MAICWRPSTKMSKKNNISCTGHYSCSAGIKVESSLSYLSSSAYSIPLGIPKGNEASSVLRSFFFVQASLKSSLLKQTSSPSPFVLFPWCHILCVRHLYWKARAHPPLLLKSTWAWHIHVPATRLLVEDRIQVRVIIGVIADQAGAVFGLLLRNRGLVTGGLVVLWPLSKRVKLRFEGVGWSSILGASNLPLWQECLPPFAPLCHLGLEGGL